MKTLKLQITNGSSLLEHMRTFSSIVRMAYNRYLDGLDETGVRRHVKQYFHGNSWLMQSAVRYAHGIYSSFGTKRVVFGGRFNLMRYLKGKITKAEYKYARLMPVCIYGETRYGNRLVNFDLVHQRVFYKPTRGCRIEIAFHAVRKKLQRELLLLQDLVEQKKIALTVRFTDKNLYLTYDDGIVCLAPYLKLKDTRILGLDLNPGYIGLSVLDFAGGDSFRVLHKEVVDLSVLVRATNRTRAPLRSYSPGKLRHETFAIAHRIDALVDYWKCGRIAIEDLKVPARDLGKGRAVNRLCNNRWPRRLFIDKIKMLAYVHGYEAVEVNPAYSSIIGNFAYGDASTPDMVAASIEIGRRAYKKFEKGWFYPRFSIERVDEQWKQTLAGATTWKELAQKVKESGRKYRFLLTDCVRNAVFSGSHSRKMWRVLHFA